MPPLLDINDPLFTSGMDVFDNISPILGSGLSPDQYTELQYRDAGSPVESFDRKSGGGKATRVFRVDWDNRGSCIADILGYPAAYTTGSGTFQRHLPMQHPEFPWLLASRVTRVQGHGPYGGQPIGPNGLVESFTEFDNGQRMLRYQYAALTVEFEAIDYAIKGDQEIITSTGTARRGGEWKRFVSPKIKPQADYLTVPGGGYLWDEGPGKTGQQGFFGPIGRTISTADIELTWHQVPFNALPFDDIIATLGKVNNAYFFALEPHTVLLLAVDLRRVKNPYGMWEWEVKYSFKYRKTGHNKFFYYSRTTGQQGFYQVSVDGVHYDPGLPVDDGKLAFDENDFWKLFTGA